MISKSDRAIIAEIAGRYSARRVLLFGSAAFGAGDEPRDIDLAVDGVDPSRFFLFYGELIFALSKPVDLIDLGVKSKFAEIVAREGVPIYG